MDREPIEIGRSRRPMECELTEAERKIRSDQVHSHLEIRSQKEAERDKLEAQAKATKEMGKAKDEEITELDLKIKELSTAVRTGRATVEVEVISLYDPTKGEMIEMRADTDLITPLGRKPTIQEWDVIKGKLQVTVDEVIARPTEATPAPADPLLLRVPAEVPGIGDLTIYGDNAATWFGVGLAIGLEDAPEIDDDEVAGEYLRRLIGDLGAQGRLGEVIVLSPAEQEQLLAGLRAGASEAGAGGVSPFFADVTLRAAQALGQLHREKGTPPHPVAKAVAESIGLREIGADQQAGIMDAYRAGHAGKVPPSPAAAKAKRGRPKKGQE